MISKAETNFGAQAIMVSDHVPSSTFRFWFMSNFNSVDAFVTMNGSKSHI